MSAEISGGMEKYSNRWSVLGAIIMVIAGLLAISLPLATTLALSVLLAWLLIGAGIGHLIAAFRFTNFASFIWELIVATTAIFVGVYLRVHPVMGPLAFTFALAVLFLASGISEFALFFRIRSSPHSGWILINAVLDIIIGLIVLRNWPASSFWVLGVLVGISLFFAGLSRLVLNMGVSRQVGGAAPA